MYFDAETNPAVAGPRLLADIGGTNARFAWQAAAGQPIEKLRIYRCTEHASLFLAIRRYLSDIAQPAPAVASIAIANPVTGDLVQMTNHGWSFSVAELRHALGLRRLLVLNDFTALALALPLLTDQDRRQVGGSEAKETASIALIGPGTGLGVSGLLPDGRGGWVPLQGEGGHVSLAANSPREQQVLSWLDARYGHASAERAICGQGLCDLHAALQAIDDAASVPSRLSAADILQAALERGDARCVETVDLFCAFLGSVAGNLALTLGSRGGVYVGGGIVPRLGQVFDRSAFRARFEAKGRFSGFLAEIPVYVIVAPKSPALAGAAAALDRNAA